MSFFIVLSVLIMIACVLMILVVLVQNSKGGGLAANFQASTQIMGVRRTADFLEKTTWTLAIVLVVFSLMAVFSYPKGNQTVQASSRIENNRSDIPVPTAADPLDQAE